MIIHVMGASGSGTTTIGNLIADKSDLLGVISIVFSAF